MPMLRERLATLRRRLRGAMFEQNGLPFAPITRPQELFDDPHLNATGGLAPVRPVPGQPRQSKVPLLPILLDGRRPGLRLQPPRVGEHTDELLASLGYDASEIRELKARGIVA